MALSRTSADHAPTRTVDADRRELVGLGVGRGVVIAPLAVVRPAPEVPTDEPAAADPRRRADDVAEVFVHIAQTLRDQAAASEGALAVVLDATASIAGDPALAADVRRRILGGEGPATAVFAACETFAALLERLGGPMAERVTDLRSVRDRAVAAALGEAPPGLPPLDVVSVVAAADLSAADTAALDLSLVAALLTEQGGPTGHTAIIAGQLGIPCVVRLLGITEVEPGTVVGVDAARGTVTVAPGAGAREALARREHLESELARDVRAGSTSDGHPVGLLANIGTVDDARRAAATAAEGVGLFRTEVLFLGRQTAPSIREQADACRASLDALGGRKLVVRTLDAGADKPLAFVDQADEENPALGVRGYRLARTDPGLVENQLAALASAAESEGTAVTDGTALTGSTSDLWVMAPMVATPTEARDFASRARAARLSTVGVMIEVPAAALRAQEIVAEVDFVSIGTNDLAQYTMAADRLRGELADLLDPWQPAVLDLIAMTAAAGTRAGKPVGVCGESASDPLMALVLAGLGVTSLSMSVPALPAVRFALRRHSLARCREISRVALGAGTAEASRQAALVLTDPEVRETLAL